MTFIIELNGLHGLYEFYLAYGEIKFMLFKMNKEN